MKEHCCGCSVCAVICFTNAISMRIDEEGFYRPKVDYENKFRPKNLY